MNSQKKEGSYFFGSEFNADYMFSMYEHDYPYMEQLFGIALAHFDEDQDITLQKFRSSDREGFRRSIHKIKSTFGFTGMLLMQDRCEDIERKCEEGGDFEAVKSDCEILLQKIIESRVLLQEEFNKLKNFNQLTQ